MNFQLAINVLVAFALGVICVSLPRPHTYIVGALALLVLLLSLGLLR